MNFIRSKVTTVNRRNTEMVVIQEWLAELTLRLLVVSKNLLTSKKDCTSNQKPSSLIIQPSWEVKSDTVFM